MRILHTADVHLREPGDERWQALEEILELAQNEKIDFLAISGDLFDTENIGELLRPRVSNLFSGRNFKILLIPGNHDKKVFGQGHYFGENVHVFRSLEKPLNLDNVEIWGFPFADLEGPDLLQRLRKIKKGEKSDWQVLLFHGELLDAFFPREDFGDEGTRRYLPVWLSYFEELGLDYILAGHFHSGMRLWDIPGGGSFIYSGSPVAVTRRERGPRKVNLLELGKSPVEIELKSKYYQNVEVEISPLEDEAPAQKVEDLLRNLPPNAVPLLEVTGYVDCNRVGKTEEQVVGELRGLAQDYCGDEPPNIEVRDVGMILQEDLFKTFEEKLKGIDYPDRKSLWEMALRARLEVKR